MTHRNIAFLLSALFVSTHFFNVSCKPIDQELNNKLYKACKANDISTAQDLITQGADVHFYKQKTREQYNKKTVYTKSLVLLALENKSPEMLTLLLENGAHPDGIETNTIACHSFAPLAYLYEVLCFPESSPDYLKGLSDVDACTRMTEILLKAGAYPNPIFFDPLKQPDGEIEHIRLLQIAPLFFIVMDQPKPQEEACWLALYRAFTLLLDNLQADQILQVEGIESYNNFTEFEPFLRSSLRTISPFALTIENKLKH